MGEFKLLRQNTAIVNIICLRTGLPLHVGLIHNRSISCHDGVDIRGGSIAVAILSQLTIQSGEHAGALVLKIADINRAAEFQITVVLQSLGQAHIAQRDLLIALDGNSADGSAIDAPIHRVGLEGTGCNVGTAGLEACLGGDFQRTARHGEGIGSHTAHGHITAVFNSTLGNVSRTQTVGSSRSRGREHTSDGERTLVIHGLHRGARSGKGGGFGNLQVHGHHITLSCQSGCIHNKAASLNGTLSSQGCTVNHRHHTSSGFHILCGQAATAHGKSRILTHHGIARHGHVILHRQGCAVVHLQVLSNLKGITR